MLNIGLPFLGSLWLELPSTLLMWSVESFIVSWGSSCGTAISMPSTENSEPGLFSFPFNLQLNVYGWYYGIYNTSNERSNPHWKILTVGKSPCRPPAPSLSYWTLDQFTSAQDSMTSEGCPKTDCKKKKKKKANYFLPGLLLLSVTLSGGWESN